ncbi:MAG: NAD-dependent epimerase/dehydratase family protein [Candidatus Omnitrophica bacterium]|nr:NAD-dependent epimerase/dehydratase family protein [Candidatus Omnitrophota bacterium]MBU4303664.1 NAD-dependent epimerase/dehydratase family protein [Candidatus Omnitrophota bacterium]MBU4467980.1 NAD-dependent epimerase/dehydratase family protein [Candidatus Omnitrophota bacterium]MCG2707657.1 NAD-dependent epimerase/dehydratase family protein [Candidatus Omnitrophota bacterium]
MKTSKIAILGATSHIAKGLILNFMQSKENELFLFARIPKKVKEFLEENSLPLNRHIYDFKHFQREKYDVIINCVGLGTPAKVKEARDEVFKLTEEFDNMILEYLYRYPVTLYINFSSGAVYSISVNDIEPEHYYGIAKLHQEAKHRVLKKLNIVDIRIFSYFSRFIELDSGYFLTELLKSLRKKKTFTTNASDFIRDFLSPQDLFTLICLIIKAKPFNGVIDAYSSKPISKFKLLDYFVKNYSLKYTIDRNLKLVCPTGVKNRYCSSSRKAAGLGYKPKSSSLETVVTESKYILGAANE